MKTLQITFACLILLIGQVVLSDAKTPKPVIIPAPVGVNTSWGHSVDISGKTLVAGYTSYTGNAGGVFILEQKEKRWEVLNHFESHDGRMRDWFGHAVAISGNTAVIGAYEFGGKRLVAGFVLGEGPGRVYTYRRGGTKFVPVQNFVAADAQNNR